MKLKLDENISRLLKPILVGLGHDVETVGDENLLSSPDEKVAKAAFAEGRMLFTLDIGFADPQISSRLTSGYNPFPAGGIWSASGQHIHYRFRPIQRPLPAGSMHSRR